MEYNTEKLLWTREPKDYMIGEKEIRITIEPETDLWQRTYYGFRNDSAPVLQMATTDISASVKSMWYRFSRRESDYCIECSRDGVHFKQMRICHMWKGNEEIRFGIYACSPEEFSSEAVFSHMEITDCKWLAHK